MSSKDLAADAAISIVAGLFASKVMDGVTTRIYEAQSDEAKKHETDVSYGVAYNVAVRKTADRLGLRLTEQQVNTGGQVMHYGLGIALAPTYMILRRRTTLTPPGAGITAGVVLYAVLDEAINPLLGFTPPPQAYPLVTHLRGLAGHVVLGLALASAVEGAWAVSGRRP